jgi:hypothetical protein
LKRYTKLISWFAVLWVAVMHSLSAQTDESKNQTTNEIMAQLRVTIFLGTHEATYSHNCNLKEVSSEELSRLNNQQHFNFKYYKKLGEDTQPIYKNKENHAKPLCYCEEIMIQFEPISPWHNQQINIDLELWIHKQKVLKAITPMKREHCVFLQGPKWRKGTIIIEVSVL